MFESEMILASESPRRRQLLEEAGFKFTVHPPKISENLENNLNVDEQILTLAGRKARAVLEEIKKTRTGPTLILAADTMVIHQSIPLGKPKDAEDAFQILRRLSGSVHLVKTGMAIITHPSQFEIHHLEMTEVEFKTLTDQEIRDYIATGEPFDKAGAYGIQGGGGEFVARYSGLKSNVIGLPVERFQEILMERKWSIKG